MVSFYSFAFIKFCCLLLSLLSADWSEQATLSLFELTRHLQKESCLTSAPRQAANIVVSGRSRSSPAEVCVHAGFHYTKIGQVDVCASDFITVRLLSETCAHTGNRKTDKKRRAQLWLSWRSDVLFHLYFHCEIDASENRLSA